MPFEFKHLDFELKADESTEGQFTGYGSVFGNKDLGGDVIAKGAFDKTLAKSKETGKLPKMLWQHDPSQPIGVYTDMSVDDRGLKATGQLLLDIPQARTVHTLMKANALGGLSIGYQTKDYEILGKGEDRYREIKEVDLWELSVVTFPMNPEAEVTDVKQHLQSPREVEQILRKAGVPGTFAKLVALHGYEEALNRLNGHREGDDEIKATLLETLKGLKETINA